jgi:hypothetical protein
MHDNFTNAWNFMTMEGWSMVCYAWIHQFKIWFVETCGKSLHDLIFCGHLPLIFIVTTIVHVIGYLLVISIKRPTFVFTCCSIMKILVFMLFLESTIVKLALCFFFFFDECYNLNILPIQLFGFLDSISTQFKSMTTFWFSFFF